MDSVKVVLNSDGVRDLLRSEEIMDICTKQAKKIQQRAGKGYEISQYTGVNRVNVSVGAVTEQAAAGNRGTRNDLLKAVGG